MNSRGFEHDFVAALFADPPDAALAAQPGFAVYRNTVRKACIDALEANFPAVVRLVGREWFRAAAAQHAAVCLPRDPCLLRYGEDFADFLAGFGPAASLPYLPHVARLDRLWTEAHGAADAPALPADSLAAEPPHALPYLRLRLHPSARWRWFKDQPIHSIWSANRGADAAALDTLRSLAWSGEGTLIVRPTAEVRWHPLDAPGSAFLDACARGDTLGHAATAVLATHPRTDLAALLARLLRANAFTAIDRSPPP